MVTGEVIMFRDGKTDETVIFESAPEVAAWLHNMNEADIPLKPYRSGRTVSVDFGWFGVKMSGITLTSLRKALSETNA